MVIRFLIMPTLSLLFVWLTAGRGWYIDDRLVWQVLTSFSVASAYSNIICRFLLAIIPAGPSAMLLASVAENVNVDQGPIAGYLVASVSASLDRLT